MALTEGSILFGGRFFVFFERLIMLKEGQVRIPSGCSIAKTSASRITSISPGQTKTPLLRSPAILKNTATCSASITIS